MTENPTTVTVVVLDGWEVGTYPCGHVFTVPSEQVRRLVELGAVEVVPAVPAVPAVPTPEPVAVDDVEVRIVDGFRSLPRADARALIAAGEASLSPFNMGPL